MSSIFLPDRTPLRPDFWREIFGNDRPVAVEIGPGLGEFLEAIARHRPDWNYFAIERAQTRTLTVQEKIDKHGLDNARALCSEAQFVLALLPDDCVDRFYIQFPDPWWKRRHHRRRLMTPAFAAELARTLRPGCEIEFVSDVKEYFDLAFAALEAQPALEHIPTDPKLLTATSFSRKAAVRGWELSASIHRKRNG